jgi:hypothetical protein
MMQQKIKKIFIVDTFQMGKGERNYFETFFP